METRGRRDGLHGNRGAFRLFVSVICLKRSLERRPSRFEFYPEQQSGPYET